MLHYMTKEKINMEEKKVKGKVIYSDELPEERLENIHRLHLRMLKEMCDGLGVDPKDIHSEITLTHVPTGVKVNEVLH